MDIRSIPRAKENLHAKITADINDYIDEDLRRIHNLDLTTREKFVMNVDDDNEQAKTLCYDDVTLFLLPNPDGIRDLLAMEVDFKHTKEHQRKPKRKIFVFSEVNNLIFDPVLLMIILALNNDAFESNIRSVRDIFRTR
ncbi:hypothetical protein GJ744_010445, partial [Endocarpon pusillum]